MATKSFPLGSIADATGTDRLFAVVMVRRNGQREIVNRFLNERGAKAYVDGFNQRSGVWATAFVAKMEGGVV